MIIVLIIIVLLVLIYKSVKKPKKQKTVAENSQEIWGAFKYSYENKQWLTLGMQLAVITVIIWLYLKFVLWLF